MADPEAAIGAAPGARAADPLALATVLRRLARQREAPWLHSEVARRMAERLPLIRLQPDQVVDWWSFLGGGAGLLAQAHPKANFTAVEPTPALLARSRAALRAPWWSARRWQHPLPRSVLDSQPPAADRAATRRRPSRTRQRLPRSWRPSSCCGRT